MRRRALREGRGFGRKSSSLVKGEASKVKVASLKCELLAGDEKVEEAS